MKKGCWSCCSNAPGTGNPTLKERAFKVVIPNISGGAEAPQPRGGLFGLLAGLDQASVESYLSLSEAHSAPLPPSPFTGLLLSLRYDPVEVLALVDQLWPERWAGHTGRGRKPADPLPLVCFLLRFCDPEYGTVFNLSEAYRSLKRDWEYQELCWYQQGVPSDSVFRSVYSVMVGNWPAFQACVANGDGLKAFLARLVSGRMLPLGNSGEAVNSSVLREAFSVLGPNGNFPPAYLDDARFCEVSRPVGRPRGRAARLSVAAGGSGGSDSGAGKEGFPASSRNSRRRDWPAYNRAQTHEATDVMVFLGRLSDLISAVAAPAQGPRRRGGQPYPLGKVVFACVEKVYSGLSSRRHEGVLRLSAQHGFVRNAPLWTPDGFDFAPLAGSSPIFIPQFNTVERYLRCRWLTPLLLELVTLVARPLREIEHVFAIDGTGWSTRWYDRWQDGKEAPESERQQWVKMHLLGGVKTNVVARAAISPGNHHDSPYFKGLVTEANKHFDVHQVLADLGYSGSGNYALGGELGYETRVPFKSNTLPPADDGSEWSRNLWLFLNDKGRFMEEYHQRSNIESTNGSLKVTHPQKLRGKGFCAQENEALAILVAYNLRVLAREVWMRGLELDLESEVLVFEDCIREVVEMRMVDA